MAQSLEEYVAQATKAYQPASDAIQSQLNALSGQLATTEQKINKNFAQQQAGLNRNRNIAAETASLQAAGSGGSFGGAANIANRKYYDQTFVPAQTQLQTNQANELATARQANEDQRTSLNAQLANLQAQANQEALRQYWAEVEAEKERENQRRIAASSAAASVNPYAYLDDGYGSSNGKTYKNWDFGNGYTLQALPNGQAAYYKNGKLISAGLFLNGTRGGNMNVWRDVWNNGVSTNGVGSDTISAFRIVPHTNKESKYSYLF